MTRQQPRRPHENDLHAPASWPARFSAADASRAGSTSADGACRAPATCRCARTIVASAATVHARTSASSEPARSLSRMFSQAPSPDQRRCRLYTVFQYHQPVIIPPMPLPLRHELFGKPPLPPGFAQEGLHPEH